MVKLLKLTIYLVNVLTFCEIHPFGLGIRESSRFIRNLWPWETEDHGQQTLRSPVLGQTWSPDLHSCRFVIHAFPERIGHGLLRPVKAVQAFLYIFLMGVGLDLHWQYPDTEFAVQCSEGVSLFFFSWGPHSCRYTIATGRIRAQFPSCSH